MIFNTITYFAAFLLPAVLLIRRLSTAGREWLIAVIGALFFVTFSISSVGGIPGALCLGLLLAISVLTLAVMRRGSKVGLALVLVAALATLGFFKYSNFFLTSMLGVSKVHPLYWKDAFLPLGISFFTFEFVHYAVDVYLGKTEPVRPGKFLAFILFFPTMVAGPIKRIQDFSLDVHPAGSRDALVDWHRGITRILVGLAKKFAIADLLTAITDHLVRSDIVAANHRLLPVIWIFAYGIKIYMDFSAYSDIAIGSSRILGIKVPENFDNPYGKTNIAQFWQHWHISLYRWLVDYVFIPCGGSRGGAVATYRNTWIVMLVSGLWHGAGWQFLVWGAWHAFGLSVHRLWSRGGAGGWLAARIPATILIPVSWVVTFVYVNLGWSFFAMDFPTALLWWRKVLLG